MLSLALVVAFAGMAQASYNSIVEWMNDHLDRVRIVHEVQLPHTIRVGALED